MEFRLTKDTGAGTLPRSERYAMFEGSEECSHMTVCTIQTRFAGSIVPGMFIGGVGTEPQHRRSGCVRRQFEHIFPMAEERGWAVSLLHPFSFSYYRKFGYEKVSEHKILEFPMKALDFAPRQNGFVPASTPERLADAAKVYEAFAAAGRHLMFVRMDTGLFESKNGRKTYLRYNAQGEPIAYVIIGLEDYLYVNRMVSVNLHVYEYGYTSPEALWDILGFLRMFEGEMDTIKVHDYSMAPELDGILRHYTHTRYTAIPDIMAKVLDTEKLLLANAYPQRPGHFVLKVEDDMPRVAGTFAVEYADGCAEVRRIAADAPADITASAPALSQLLYAYQPYSAQTAAYLPGVKMGSSAEDFFRAFVPRPRGVFEHF